MSSSKSSKASVQQPLLTEGANEPAHTIGEVQQNEQNKVLKYDKTIRIAVSGDVFITELERKIVDTPDFQRLRGVRQLGSALHVYPSAIHTRFDHLLGTLAMAARMVECIEQNSPIDDPDETKIDGLQRRLIRLYALLHDITHVPFGHTIEDELGLITRHDENPKRILTFLGPDSPIGKLIRDDLGAEAYKRFMCIYVWDDNDGKPSSRTPPKDSLSEWREINPDDAFIHDLVSNTVCADLLDYIARDNYFCNLSITLEYRFLNFLYIGRHAGKRRLFVRLWKGKHKVPRRDTLTDLVRLLEARYMIAERVYFHHAKISSGAMIGRAIQDAITTKQLSEDDLLVLSDDGLVNKLANCDTETSRRLARAFIERRLHKRIRDYELKDFAGSQAHNHNLNIVETLTADLKNHQSRRHLENEIADELEVPAGDILVYVPSSRNMNRKEARMKVFWEGEAKTLGEINDEIVGPRLRQVIQAHHNLWRCYLLGAIQKDDYERRDLCDEKFRAKFLSRNEPDGGSHATSKYYERIIFRRLSRDSRPLPSADALVKVLSKAAEELLVSMKDDKNWDAKLEAVIRKFF